jgi:hypothetical protein
MITGIGVHDPPESMFTIDWNLCSRSNGIGVHDPPESAALTEFLAPAPHSLVGDDHAPFLQNQLNVPKTQAEHVV